MKLHASTAAGATTITGYGEGWVSVNHERHTASLIVLPERVLPWDAAGFEALAGAHFEQLAALGPEIVLLGTGATLRFPHASITQALARARIGLEVMDLRAACRTFNILIGEGRKVAAALLFT